MNFHNQHAIITGGSSGIGRATARLLTQRGAHVSIIARRQELLDEALARAPGSLALLSSATLFDLNNGEIDRALGRLALGLETRPHSGQLLALRAQVLARGERLEEAERDARKAFEMGACRIINIKAGRVGGLSHAKAIQEIAASREAPVWCGGMLESGIGRAHNVHLSTLPNFTLPGDVSASDRYFERDVVEPPFSLNPDGTMDVPQGLGIGVEVDRSFLDEVTVRREVFA